MPEIPEPVKEILTNREIENIENRDGWAFGTVCLVQNGNVGEQLIEDAVIELMNGEGGARNMSGVKFMAETDGELREAYAYGSAEAFHQSRQESGWYVESFDEPEDPNVGKAAP